MTTSQHDLDLLRRAIALSHSARAHGNRPFGALLVDREGQVLSEAENSAYSDGDPTAHAELNAIRAALAGGHSPAALVGATAYASGEPCAMCAAALFWAGVDRVLFALGSDSLLALEGSESPHLALRCRDVLGRSSRPITVEGPLLADEAARAFDGFFR